ncbi:MAG: response regulator transcription factor [Burkholderiaceae bacterium]|nr:response regulator transcription factor [Burkholderiaceae bacterium]
MQLVLAGGTCFPTSSWSEHTQIPLSLVPDAEKPLTFSGDPANDGPIHPTATSSSHRQIQKYTRRATDKSTSTSTYPSNSTCGESEMLGLTPRQYEVLVLLAKGYPMKTVGRQLNISVATAKAHTESLYQRLDVRNRNAAVYAAINRGATLGWECIPNQFQAGAPS